MKIDQRPLLAELTIQAFTQARALVAIDTVEITDAVIGERCIEIALRDALDDEWLVGLWADGTTQVIHLGPR